MSESQPASLSPSELNALIARSRDKFRSLIDAVPDPMFTIDRDLKLVSVNQAYARLTGKHPKEVVGGRCYEFFCPLDLNGEEACRGGKCLAFRFFQTGETIWELLEQKMSDNQRRWTEVMIHPLDDQASSDQAVVMFRDVTRLKELEQQAVKHNEILEEEVRRRTLELREARDELLMEKQLLENANRELLRLESLKKDLMLMVVHDMKGPIGELMGNLDLIKLESLSTDQIEYVELAESACDDLLRMIMNLLDINRAEEGRLVPEFRALSPSRLIENTLFKLQALIRLAELDVEILCETSLFVRGDSGLLERVLQNLLINAVNATPPGGRISLGARSHDGGDMLEFSVRDTGKGIPVRFRKAIFEKFKRASDDAENRTGTGLGLSFCKLAIEAHGGSIRLESEEGRGTTFFFTLPALSSEI